MNHITEPKWDFRDDFITIIDDALSDDFCDKLIWLYERAHSAGVSYTRKQQDNAPNIMKQDTSVNLSFEELSISSAWKIYTDLTQIVNNHFNTYFEKYNVDDSMLIQGIKIQKTNPSEGYHIWHSDGGGKPSSPMYRRCTTFIYYLNDVEEGGETEFLYQKQRISPVKGRGVWFPGAYTHVHRGNPPLKETKYIMTGWLEYSE